MLKKMFVFILFLLGTSACSSETIPTSSSHNYEQSSNTSTGNSNSTSNVDFDEGSSENMQTGSSIVNENANRWTLSVRNQQYVVEVEENETVQALKDMLPLTMTMDRLH